MYFGNKSTKKSKNSNKMKDQPSGVLKKPPPTAPVGKPEQTPGKAVTPGDKTLGGEKKSDMFSPITKNEDESGGKPRGEAKKDVPPQDTRSNDAKTAEIVSRGSENTEGNDNRANSSAWNQGYGRIGGMFWKPPSVSTSTQEVDLTHDTQQTFPEIRSNSDRSQWTGWEDHSKYDFEEPILDLEDTPFSEIRRLVNDAFIELGANTAVFKFKIDASVRKSMQDGFGIRSFTTLADVLGRSEHLKDFRREIHLAVQDYIKSRPHLKGHIIAGLLEVVIFEATRRVMEWTFEYASDPKSYSQIPRLFGSRKFTRAIVKFMDDTNFPFQEQDVTNLLEDRGIGSTVIASHAV